MSATGRKSSYRKSVTEAYTSEYPLPSDDGDCIALVQGTRGSNIFELKLPLGDLDLAILPNKFKKVIWLKRGDYVIASSSIQEKGADTKVNFMIKNILSKEQIKHIKSQNMWSVHNISLI